ncbi:MAG: RNA polymerase factor sigma-54 [candidate division WOR-3 bacterium]|nr:RNA polymerase factor sigma-54 [candidate division WOR-3 bacterium]MCX7837274.1 RNA polymerase factor sigma-54 [candidate division WOR-3 bacterium]MDW8113721.1 RNA polymerase factor sigma-54 [candidate division WOR-3 bacterium]
MRQEIRLEQKLILTPQLLLNLKLLALPILDLETVIEQELATNPCLEIEEEKSIEEIPQEELKTEKEDEFSLEDLLPGEGYSFFRDSEEVDILDVANPAPVTSVEELLTKLRQKIDKEDYPIAEFVCNSLDENGFLEFSIEEIAQTLGVKEERIERIIEIMKKIEPGGIGSRTLKEALLAQLELKGFDKESIEVRMLKECEELVKAKNFKKIAAKLKTNEARIKEAFNNLANLEPRPLRKYGSQKADYVVPDFKIKIEGEKVSVEFNEENLPRLRIANYYKEILLNPKNYEKEQVEFVRKKYKNAVMFIKALEERKEILRKIVEYIIENQKDFFLISREIIKPLSIKECGEKLGIHPSNVSRAIAGKYLETPFGIFSLRSFFSSGVGEVSKATIKAKIKALIDNEDKSNPLTDDEIVKKLKEIGINIKRRTVAKYRQELNIPKTSERKNK